MIARTSSQNRRISWFINSCRWNMGADLRTSEEMKHRALHFQRMDPQWSLKWRFAIFFWKNNAPRQFALVLAELWSAAIKSQVLEVQSARLCHLMRQSLNFDFWLAVISWSLHSFHEANGPRRVCVVTTMFGPPWLNIWWPWETRDYFACGEYAMLESYRKYCSWIYKGLGIVLQINTASVSGAVSRALAQVIGSLMFPLEDLTR